MPEKYRKKDTRINADQTILSVSSLVFPFMFFYPLNQYPTYLLTIETEKLNGVKLSGFWQKK